LIREKLDPQIIQNWNFRRPYTCHVQDEFAGSSKDRQINQEGISQPVLAVQKVVRNFLKSFRWATKCLFQNEVNVARKKLLPWFYYGVHPGNTTIEKQIPPNCTERCSL